MTQPIKGQSPGPPPPTPPPPQGTLSPPPIAALRVERGHFAPAPIHIRPPEICFGIASPVATPFRTTISVKPYPPAEAKSQPQAARISWPAPLRISSNKGPCAASSLFGPSRVLGRQPCANCRPYDQHWDGSPLLSKLSCHSKNLDPQALWEPLKPPSPPC